MPYFGIFNTMLPTLVNGQQVSPQVDSRGRLVVVGSGDSTSAPTFTQAVPLTNGTDRSGTAGTTAATLAAANATRRGLTLQNISAAATIGVNEIGGTAAIGTVGTYTVSPGATLRVNTARAISVIASAAATPYTATEF